MTNNDKAPRLGEDSETLRQADAGASHRVRSSDVVLKSGAALAGGRLIVQRVLGQGAMGVVYQALDSERRSSVALKTLSSADPSSVYSFKNEFRFLAGVHHRNLVQLYELFAEGDVWFFTMELVHGVSFDRWVRPDNQLHEPRLREALRQLTAAVSKIHSVGKLHRDLKPSNVLVTSEGRVVVLDFGLAVEPELGGVGHTIQTYDLAGTPLYMSPEQASGLPSTSASDYYAVGVMLFEALVGRVPFEGNVLAILSAKQRFDAPDPSQLAPDAPPELASLCTELLQREPSQRAGLAALHARLGVDADTEPRVDPGVASITMVDRVDELRQLMAAFESALRGETVVVVISGESGIGKSALCDHFLRQLRDDNAALVLAGRCHEHETVPFKAVDAVVDELSRYLRRLPDEKAAALMPRDAYALLRLFPVLGRVSVLAEAPPPTDSNPQEVQRRGFLALGELFARLRDRQPLVICLDDLQWTDADSVALLRHMMFGRNLVPMLVVIAYRSENAENRLLGRVLDAAASNSKLRVQRLLLGPLQPSDAERLASQLLGADGAADPTLGAAIARESGGSPFFATELARSARSGVQTSDRAPSVTAALLARVALLPAGAQRLLEVLALVGCPLSLDVLREAVLSEPDDLDALRRAQLIRSREHEGMRMAECYHDRIRESVSAALSDSVKAAHYAALANSPSARNGGIEPELLGLCMEQIGDARGASQQLLAAAEHASTSMAFDRAATLFQRVLELDSAAASRQTTLVRLGCALENAGRGSAAADAFVQAAQLSAAEVATELRRRASEQLLVTGHLEDGRALLESVCRESGLTMPVGKRSALAAYAWNSLQLRFRSLELPDPSARQVSERERLQLRVASTLVTGLIGYLPLQAASSASRYLLLALRHGESTDLIRGLGFHAYIQTLVEPNGRYANVLLERMDALAKANGRPEATGFASLMKGTSAYHCGSFSLARGHLTDAVSALRGCSGVDWEIDCAHVYEQLIASDTGTYSHIAQTTPALIDEALRRGRVWTAAMLSGFGVHAWLLPDDPAGYSRVLAEAKRQWRASEQPRWPDLVMLAGESQQLIYQGRALEAFELLEAQYKRFAQSELTRSAGAGIAGFAAHHGKAAAAALGSRLASPSQATRMRAVLNASVASLRRAGGAKRTGIASLFEAALAIDRGDREAAYSCLVKAAEVLESAEALMWTAAARRRAGQLIGGTLGAKLIEQGDAFIRSQGTQNLEAMTEVNCSGCVARA